MIPIAIARDGHKGVLEEGPEWMEAEKELLRSGARLPLFHRLAWAKCDPHSRHCFVTVSDENSHTRGGVAVQIDESRVLPGHCFMRVMQFGEGLPANTWGPLISELVELSQKHSRVLRLRVGIFSRDHRHEIAAILSRHGFHRAPQQLSYRFTLTIDLRPEENEILKHLNKSARKNLHAADKSSLDLRVLTDPIYAGRIGVLEQAAVDRTGGVCEMHGWGLILELSRRHPELSRLVGMFRSSAETGPDALVGFAWGCMHGDHGEYRAGGTARLDDSNVSISHRLLRDLMFWSKSEGAAWFDMGGITLLDSPDDPRRGITAFKRHFTHHMEEVGEEWVLEPRPARARFAEMLGGGVRGFAGVLAQVTGMGNGKGH